MSVIVQDIAQLSVSIEIDVHDSIAIQDSPKQELVSYIYVWEAVFVNTHIIEVFISSEVYVFSSITLTDAVTCTVQDISGLQINIADPPLVLVDSPTVEVLIPDLSNLFDNLYLSDVIYTDVLVEVYKFDSLFISDLTYVSVDVEISEQENLFVSDAFVIDVITNVFVNDNIVLTEYLEFSGFLGGINTADDISLNDWVNVVTTEAGVITINVFDTIQVQDNTVLSVDVSVSVYDSAVINESITFDIKVSIDSFDTLIVTESIYRLIPELFLNVWDNVVISDIVITDSTKVISVSSSISLSDVVYLEVSETILTASTGVVISDVVTVFVEEVPTIQINVYDFISVSDSPDVSPVLVQIDIYDELFVADLGFVERVELQIIIINLFDSIAISDAANVSVIEANARYVNVFDALFISDFVDIDITDAGIFQINVFDSIYIDQFINAETSSLIIGVYDSILIAETLYRSTTVGNIIVWDNVRVASYSFRDIFININVANLINVSDIVTNRSATIGGIFVWDNISVSDFSYPQVTSPGDTNIFVYDAVNIADVDSVLIPDLFLSVSDLIIISETIFRHTVGTINIYDSIYVVDISFVESGTVPPENIAVSELTYVSDWVRIELHPLEVNVYGNIGVVEGISSQLVSHVAVNDAISVSDAIYELLLSNIAVFDAVYLNESINVVNPLLEINVYTTVRVADYIIVLPSAITIGKIIEVVSEIILTQEVMAEVTIEVELSNEISLILEIESGV